MTIQKILLVDDSKTELHYLSELLVKRGYAVRTAENGEEAMRRLSPEHRTALVETHLRERPYAEVAAELGIPVKLIGLGEGPDDLAPFEPEGFVDALLGEA